MRRLVALVIATSLLAVAPLATSAASAASALFPTVKGTFDHTPTLSFPHVKAPSSLEDKVLEKGTGKTVKKGDLLVANYVGQLWNGKVFDSSFTRSVPSSFQIGVGQVIPGWDKELVGARVGSRVLLVIPPVDGYGKTGVSAAGITATSVLVFVVDILASYSKSSGGDPKAAHLANGTNGITVKGSLGKAPTLSIGKSAVKPKSVNVKVLDRGDGKKLTPGLIVSQIVVTDWTGKVVQSTWAQGVPEADTIGNSAQPSVLDALVGVHVGSRVLLQLPKNSQGGGPYVVVIDIVAQPKGTASQF